jgi:hypothetical protein
MSQSILLIRREKAEGYEPETLTYEYERGRNLDGQPETDSFEYRCDRKSNWEFAYYEGEYSIHLSRHNPIEFESIFEGWGETLYPHPISYGGMDEPQYFRLLDYEASKDKVRRIFAEEPERRDWLLGLLDFMGSDPNLYFQHTY